MNENRKRDYIGYEYKEVSVRPEEVSLYLDCYRNFGWSRDENFGAPRGARTAVLRLKRDRRIVNRMELTRLQQHFEACMKEVGQLERKKSSAAATASIAVAIAGTAFMAGSTFAVVHEPPVVWLCVLLAIPGFAGWISPYFIHHRIAAKRARELQPLIEAKREEIYEICERGFSLL